MTTWLAIVLAVDKDGRNIGDGRVKKTNKASMHALQIRIRKCGVLQK